MQTVLEQGSIDKPLTFDVGLIQLSFIPVCSLNTCNISVKLCRGFALQCFSFIIWASLLSGVIRNLLCKPRAFSPAITISRAFIRRAPVQGIIRRNYTRPYEHSHLIHVNSLNRQVALQNIRRLCPPIATILVNSYRDPTDLFVDNDVILSQEGTTQGDPLAMAMYGLATIPLIRRLNRCGMPTTQPHSDLSNNCVVGGTD